MKRFLQKSLPVAAILVLSLSLTAQDNTLRHIPAGTAQIVQLDLQRLQQFMKWEEVRQLPSIAQLVENKDGSKDREQFFKYLEKPSVTGIDLSTPLYFFSHRSLEHYLEGYKGLAGKISNLQQFTAWALDVNSTIALTRPGRVKTLIKDELAFIWDTENFVIVNDLMTHRRKAQHIDTSIINTLKQHQGDSLSEAFASLLKFMAPITGEPVADKVTRSFDENAPMPESDSRMLALFRQTEPLKVWNSNTISGGLNTLINPAQIIAGVTGKREEKTSVIATASVLNFDNGRAFYTSRTYLDQQLEQYFSNPQKQPFDINITQHIALDKLIGFLTLKLNMRSLGELLREAVLKEGKEKDGLFEKMKQDGFELSDIVDAFTGDVFAGCIHPGNAGNDVPPSLVVALKVNNITAAEKIMNKWKEKAEAGERKKNEWYGLNEDKTLLLFSTSQEAAEKLMTSKTAVPHDKTLDEEIKANPFYMQLNMNELYNIMIRMEQPVREKEKAMAEMMSDIQQFRLTAGKFQNGSVLFDYELAFNNKEDNGFRQMMQMFDKMFRSITSSFEAPDNNIVMPGEAEVIDADAQKSSSPAAPVEKIMIVPADPEGIKEIVPPPPPPPHPKARFKILTKKEAAKPKTTNKKKS